MKRSIFMSCGLLCLCLSVAGGAPYTYHFTNVTNNDPVDAGIGEAQLLLELLDGGPSQVIFRLTNTGPEACSITDVYVDDAETPLLNGLLDISGTDPGVSFSEGAKPKKMPGWNLLDPVLGADFSADSDSPVQHNGVNPGEELRLLFGTDADLDALDTAISAFGLRVGIHVQGFAGGGSESFVTGGENVVFNPTPDAIALGALGVTAVGWLRRRRTL